MENSREIYVSLPLLHEKGVCPICKTLLTTHRTVNVKYIKKKGKHKETKIIQTQLPYCEFCGLVFADSDFQFKDRDGFFVSARQVTSFIDTPLFESNRIRHDCQSTINDKLQRTKDACFCERCQLSFPHGLVKNVNGHTFCVGCKKKYDNNIIELLPGKTSEKPMITVNFINPVRCRYYDHKIENVLAKVLYYNNGKIVPHVIDMSYCPSCNRFFILNTVLELYKKEYGRLLLEREYQDWTTQKGHVPYEYAPDTILSRWGYCAQEGKQSESERRSILSCMIEYNREYKEEIKSILNSFINKRKNCYKAIPLWKSDLLFVCEYDIGQAFVDFTNWQLNDSYSQETIEK